MRGRRRLARIGGPNGPVGGRAHGDFPAIAFAPNGPDEGLAAIAEGLAQLGHLKPKRIVGDCDVRPDLFDDFLPRQEAPRIVQEEEKELAALVQKAATEPAQPIAGLRKSV